MRTRSVRHRGGIGPRKHFFAGPERRVRKAPVHRRALAVLGALLCSFFLAQPAAGAKVWVLEIDGAIGPASADYFIRSLEDAEDAGVDLVVLRLDTPGGLDKSMRDMIKALLASRVPVATYVSPNGARAASAGTYIMYASHVAAMAPATNIGSSTPVSIGGGGPLPIPQAPQPEEPPADETAGEGEGEGSGEEPAATPGTPAGPASGGAMERKVVNDAVAYIRGIAELRGRNVEWAEQTVREASNLPAREALEQNVIDLVVEDLDELLAALDGETIDVDGAKVTLDTSDNRIERIEPDWRYELLGLIADPNVAYLLLMIGVYGLIFEFYNPGTGVGGVAGIICLLLGAYALQMLPVNYAGLALVVVGLGLLVAEAFTPSFGVLGTGGVIAFLVGSLILFDTDLPGYRVSIPIILAMTAATAGLVVFVAGAALRAWRSPVVSGGEALIGAEAIALEDFDGEGSVRAAGEVWHARSEGPVAKGAALTVTSREGLDLTIEPREDA